MDLPEAAGLMGVLGGDSCLIGPGLCMIRYTDFRERLFLGRWVNRGKEKGQDVYHHSAPVGARGVKL